MKRAGWWFIIREGSQISSETFGACVSVNTQALSLGRWPAQNREPGKGEIIMRRTVAALLAMVLILYGLFANMARRNIL